MWTCKKSVDLLLDYLDGDLEGELRSKLEAHLGACPPCLEFLKAYEQTPRLCRKALSTKMPAELDDKLQAFLDANLPKK